MAEWRYKLPMNKANRPDSAPKLPEPSSPIGFEEEGSAYEVDTPDGSNVRETGPDVIKSYLARLPEGPGVYRMLDTKGEVLYVGKARSLRNRVSSYTRYEGHTTRIQRMIAAAASLIAVVTRTETEALLLESISSSVSSRATMCCCATIRAFRIF